MLWEVFFRQDDFRNAQDDSAFKALMLAHGKPPIPVGEKLEPNMADFLDQCLTVNRHERASATLLLHHEVFGCVNEHSKTTMSTLVNKVTNNMKK
jgi:serine/threonine protein kinase